MSKLCFSNIYPEEEVNQPILSLEGLDEIEYLNTCGDLNRDLLHEGEGLEASYALIQAENKDPDEWGGKLISYQVDRMVQKLKVKSVSLGTDELFGQQIALEGSMARLGDAIKNVFKKIIEVIKKLWEKLVGFVKKMADSNRSLNKYLVSLKKKIEKKNFDKVSKGMEGGMLEDDSLAKKFAVGRTVTLSDVKSLITLHNRFSEKATLLPQCLDEVNKVFIDVEGMSKVTSEDSLNAKIRNISGHTAEAQKKLLGFMIPDDSFKPESAKPSGNELEIEHVYPNKEVLFEGVQIHFNINIVKPDPNDEDTTTKFTLTFEKKKSDLADASTKLQILSKRDMLDLVSETIKLTENNVKLASSIESAKRMIDVMVGHLNKLAEMPDLDASDDTKSKTDMEKDKIRDIHSKGKKQILFLRSMVSTVSEKSGAYAGMVIGLNTKLGDAAASYIRKSMDTYD